jgi:hypothetical protein
VALPHLTASLGSKLYPVGDGQPKNEMVRVGAMANGLVNQTRRYLLALLLPPDTGDVSRTVPALGDATRMECDVSAGYGPFPFGSR